MYSSVVIKGRLQGTLLSYILTGIAQRGTGQIHAYAGFRDGTLVLDFAAGINKFSHGHHFRGDSDDQAVRGSDTFVSKNTQNIAGGIVIVGRIKDFDPSNTIIFEGEVL